MSWSAMSLASSFGIANPTPMLPLYEPAPAPPASEAMAVLMPMTSPSALMSAPPELPGLMAASVWMASMTASVAPLGSSPWSPKGESRGVSCSVIDRLSALTMPALTDPSRPRGLPMASTVSPTCRSALLPRVASLRPLTFCAWMTARSVAGSRPRISASARDPSENVTERPPSSPAAATWLLVRIWPSELMTTPDPRPVPWSESKVIDTTLGKTVAAACESGSSGGGAGGPPPPPHPPRGGGGGGADEPVDAGPAGGAAGGRGGAPRPAAANWSVWSAWLARLGCSLPGSADCPAVSVCEPPAAGGSVVTACCGAGGAGGDVGPGNGEAPEGRPDAAAGAGGAGYGGSSCGPVVGGGGGRSVVGSALDGVAALAGVGSGGGVG